MDENCRECGWPLLDAREHQTHHSLCSCVCVTCAHHISQWETLTGLDWFAERNEMTPEQLRGVIGV